MRTMFTAVICVLASTPGCGADPNLAKGEGEQRETASVDSQNRNGSFSFGEPTWVLSGGRLCAPDGTCDYVGFNVSSKIRGSTSGSPAHVPYVQTENLDTIGETANVWAVVEEGEGRPNYLLGWFEFRAANGRTLNTWPNPSHSGAGSNDHACWYSNPSGNYPYTCYDHLNVRQWWANPISYPVTIVHHMRADYETINGSEFQDRSCYYTMREDGAVSYSYCDSCGMTACQW